MSKNCSILIITNNSQRELPRAMECLRKQTSKPDQIILVDSGSEDREYLNEYENWSNTKIIVGEAGMGFCRANNLGYQSVGKDCNYVLLLNPDAYIEPTFIERATEWMEQPGQRKTAVVTSPLLGFELKNECPSGLYDSTGIFQTWYGKWYDRGQGEKVSSTNYQKPESLPAVCGALMFCRKSALDEVLIRGCEIFDASFHMYKEDIDLSLRLRKKGWQLQYLPILTAYHCRGWNRKRALIEKKWRLQSARNELKLHARHCYHAIPYSLVKYLSVRFLNA